MLNPIKWINLRRNEVGAVISTRNVQTAMNSGSGDLGLHIENERQQRAGLFLRDVAYRIHAHFEMRDASRHKHHYPHLVKHSINDAEERQAAGIVNTAAKFLAMFERRAAKGQCVNQPYLGCREFSASFRLIEDISAEPSPITETRDLGWMLYDLDYSNSASPDPRFFRAEMKNGVLDLNNVEV